MLLQQSLEASTWAPFGALSGSPTSREISVLFRVRSTSGAVHPRHLIGLQKMGPRHSVQIPVVGSPPGLVSQVCTYLEMVPSSVQVAPNLVACRTLLGELRPPPV